MKWRESSAQSLNGGSIGLVERLRGVLPNRQSRRPTEECSGRIASAVWVTVLAQVMVLLLGVIDYLVQIKFQFAIVYLIPISFAALRGGFASGIITALTSTAVWFAADALGGGDHGSGWIPYWNALSRLAGFAVIAILLTRSKQLNSSLLEKARGLSREIEKRKRTEKIYADEKEILQQVACDRPLSEILEALTQKIEQWYEGTFCSIFLFDGERNRFVCLLAPSLPEDLQIRVQKMSLHGAFPPRAEGTESLSLDLVMDAAWADVRQVASEYALQACCSKPIVSATGDLLGIIALFSGQREAAGLPSVTLVEKARDIASIAIERSRLSKELRKLSELVIEAQEAERRRIARDLHDSVNQVLSSAAFRIGMIDAQLPAGSGELRDELERAKLLLTKGIDEIHRISDDLRPSELDALGLVPAIRSLCGEFQRKSNLSLKFECEPSPRRLSDAVELTIYRIIQEALNNIEKHSAASQAILQLCWTGPFVSLTIRDNGKGLESTAERVKRGRKMGMGIINMRERTAFVGGTFSIGSPRGRGTEIVVKVPLPGSEPVVEVA